MQLKVSVISDRPDEYIGKRGLVKSQIITCQDVDGVRCRLCGTVFKAERTLMDYVGDPTCPYCIASTVADFEKVN